MTIRDMGTLLGDMLSRIKLLERRLTRIGARVDPTPTGSLLMFAGATAPGGYLLAAGGTQLIADYPDLFAAIGTTYGGNGTTTFGLPDMRGRAPVGLSAGDSSFGSLNAAPGAKTHTLTNAQVPRTRIEQESPASSFLIQEIFATGLSNSTATNRGTIARAGSSSTPYLNVAGGGGSHNNIQPSRVVNFIIKT